MELGTIIVDSREQVFCCLFASCKSRLAHYTRHLQHIFSHDKLVIDSFRYIVCFLFTLQEVEKILPSAPPPLDPKRQLRRTSSAPF